MAGEITPRYNLTLTNLTPWHDRKKWTVKVEGLPEQTIERTDSVAYVGIYGAPGGATLSNFGAKLQKIIDDGRAINSSFKLPIPQMKAIKVDVKVSGTKIIYIELTTDSYMELINKIKAYEEQSYANMNKSESSKYVMDDIEGLELVTAEIIELDDGDTFKVRITNESGRDGLSYGDEIRIRFQGVDCPEYITEESTSPNDEEFEYKVQKNKTWAFRHHTTYNVICALGVKAKKFTEGIVGIGSTVYLLIDDANRIDNYGRTVAVVYYKAKYGDKYAICLNKSLVKAGLGELFVPEDTSYNMYSWLEYFGLNHFEGHYSDGERKFLGIGPEAPDGLDTRDDSDYNKEDAKLAGNANEFIFDMPAEPTEDNPLAYIDNIIPIDPQDREDRPGGHDPKSPYYFRIGDCEFVIPPISINVSKNYHNKKINALRSKGSVMTKTGHSDTLIEVELFFHDLQTINGIPVEGPEGTYHIDGLRPLIAQFKKSPFLPVINQYLNTNFDIYGATLVNLSVRTVPNFPNCLSAVLTMLKFEHASYFNKETLEEVINFPLFRWYYQQSLKPRNKFKTYFAEATSLDKDIKWKVAKEDQLEEIQTAVKALRSMPSDVEVRQRTRTQTTYQNVRADSETLLLGIKQKQRYDAAKAKNPPVIKTGFGSTSIDTQWSTWLTKHVYLGGKEPTIFVPVEQFYNADKIPYYRIELKALEHQQLAKKFESVEGLTKWYTIPISASDIISKISYATKLIDAGVDMMEEDYTQVRAKASLTEADLETVDQNIRGLIIQSINVSFENIVTSLQLQQTEGPTHQFLGSQDTHIQIKAQTVSDSTLQQFKQMCNTVERYSRDYRWGITSGFLEAENSLLKLFGVNDVLIESMNVGTVPNFPGLYDVTINLISFNKTQANAERLTQIANSTLKVEELETRYDSADKAGFETAAVEIKLKELELYPDLELPTFKELDKVLTKLGITANGKPIKKFPNPLNGKYVDPDFYVSSQETFRSMLDELYTSDGGVLKAPVSINMKDWAGLKATYKSPTADKPDGQMDIDKRILDVLGIIDKEKKKIGTMPDPNNKLDNLNSVDNTSYANGTPTTVNPSGVSQGKITKELLHAWPTPEEYARWTGIGGTAVQLKVTDDPTMSVAPSHLQGAVSNIKNPSFVEISVKIRDIVNELFIGYTPEQKLAAVAWIKGVCQAESGWGHFETRNGVQVKMPATSTAVGLMQLIPRYHVAKISEGVYDTDTARRLAWDWEFNLYAGTKYYKAKFDACRKLAKSQAKPFWWAARAYHDGNIDKDTGGTAYANKVEGFKKNYEANRYGDPSTNRNPEIEKAYLAKSDESIFTKIMNNYKTNERLERDGIAEQQSLEYAQPLGNENQDTAKSPAEIAAEATSANDKKTTGRPPDENDSTYEIFKGMMHDLMRYDMRGRLARAFPTFQMFLIDEGRWMSWYKLWDNFYGFNSIQSIDVMRTRKMAADTCIVQMTNVYSNLTQRDSDVKYGSYDFKFWDNLLPEPTESMLDARSQVLDSLMLKTGARLHLRLGYSANAANLPIVFNGTITEMGTEELITIVAQGDGLELTNKIQTDPQGTNDPGLLSKTVEPRQLLCRLMGDRENPVFAYLAKQAKEDQEEDEKLTTSEYLYKLFADKLGVALISGTATSSVGNPIALKVLKTAGKKVALPITLATMAAEELSETKAGQMLLNWIAGENPNGVAHFGKASAEGITWPWGNDYGEIGQNIYAGNGLGTFGQWLHKEGDVSVDMGAAKTGEYIGDGAIPMVSLNGVWGLPWATADEWDVCMYLFDKSIWDVGQTLAYTIPDYIFAVHPYHFRSTAFFGKPYWGFMEKYAWKYTVKDNKLIPEVVKDKSGNVKQYRKPYMQFKIYSSESDIVDNKIITSEDGVYTNVIISYNNGYGDTPMSTDIISADTSIYPEKQKTAVVTADIKAERLQRFSGVSKKYVHSYGASVLRDFLKEMYKGQLVVIGDPSVKPHDMMFIQDTFQDMEGPCLVREVVHHFSHETGFITSITPDALVVTDDMKMMNITNLMAHMGHAAAAGWLLKLRAAKAWKNFIGTPYVQWARGKVPVIKDMMIDLVEKALENDKGNAELKRMMDIFREKPPKEWRRELSTFAKQVGNVLKAEDAVDVLTEADMIDLPWSRGINKNVKIIVETANNISDAYRKAAQWGKAAKDASLLVRLSVGTGKLAWTAIKFAGPQALASVVVMWATSSMVEWLNRQMRHRQACIVAPLKHKDKPYTAGINGSSGLIYGEPLTDPQDKWLSELGESDFGKFASAWLGIDIPQYDNAKRQ